MTSKRTFWAFVCVCALSLAACSEEALPGADAARDVRDVAVADTLQSDADRGDRVDVSVVDAGDVVAQDVGSDTIEVDAVDTVVLPDTGTMSDVVAPPDVAVFDAGTDSSPDVLRDSGTDVADAATGSLFARCRSNADCGAGLTCNLTYPGGLCTMRCSTDRACGVTGICAGAYGCLPFCEPSFDDCAPFGGICFIFDAADPMRRACYPSCYTTAPPGIPACVPGRVCDHHRGDCVPPPVTTFGAADGSPCASASDCAGGRCYPTVDAMTGAPNGWNNGYCFSVGRTPPNADFVAGAPWPRSNCPVGSVAVPAGAAAAEGDPALCLRECRADAECRVAEGYRCFRGRDPMTGLSVFSTGGCMPVDCRMAGMPCPAGYTCRTVTGTGTPYGVCGR